MRIGYESCEVNGEGTLIRDFLMTITCVMNVKVSLDTAIYALAVAVLREEVLEQNMGHWGESPLAMPLMLLSCNFLKLIEAVLQEVSTEEYLHLITMGK